MFDSGRATTGSASCPARARLAAVLPHRPTRPAGVSQDERAPAPRTLAPRTPTPGTPEPTTPLHPAVGLLQRAVAACATAGAAGQLAGALDAVTLLRLAEAAQGVALRSLAEMDRAHGHAVEQPALGTHPHASAAGLLREAVGLGDGDARGRVRLAGRLAPAGDLAPLGDLLVAGRTTVAHCRAVAHGVRGLAPEVVAESLPAICTLAEHLDPVALARELRERAHAVSDELAREQERRQRERPGFWLPRSTDGVAHPKGQLPALEADVLEEALERVAQRQRTALDEAGEPDRRNAAQRRADALVALAQHALASDDVRVSTAGGTVGGPLLGAGGVRAAVTVVVTAEALAGEPGARPARTTSSAQTVLSRGTLLRTACDADVSRVVLTTAVDGSSVVLDLGRSQRTVSPGQWRALVARDRTCVVRGCARPPAHCQAHHVQHWSRGGPSDLANYALLCARHHHEVHDDEDVWHRHRDGRWLTPDGYRPAGAHPPPVSRLRYPDPAPPRSSGAPF